MLTAPPQHVLYKSLLSTLVGMTSVIIMCRVLIHLRKYASGGAQGDGLTNGGLSVASYGRPGQDCNMVFSDEGVVRRRVGAYWDSFCDETWTQRV